MGDQGHDTADSAEVSGTRSFLPAVEGMRACAAMGVVLTHVAFQTANSSGWYGRLFTRFDLAVAVFFAHRSAPRPALWLGGIGSGLAVALAWWFTYAVAHASFDPVQMQGLTFSGPSAEWLMRVLASPAPAWGFDAGMLPGVFVGSALGALVGRDFKVEGFKDGYSMARYIAGAVLMGFGSMLAGGCAVGAGMTGGAIFALTAWLTLAGMWAGGGLMHRLLDEPVQTSQPASQQAPVVLPVAP